ncbi:DNA helicase ZGRF1-like domain-containing protein [Aspergillus tanneri]|uniref:5'-3' DNA helicase ZGRF1-like N-terminal domain-containing protein n=1 Tax=Aspergillus tanneri TaxID=1220188 RepID=A0A5M9M526_9EURO|nr:uncharacterized protein ATNIH1004_010750 [Aspergillus tanneri]KAA8641811.1 hypothetical protein ATNIH1004_010750 [Aspergillus tanneri]
MSTPFSSTATFHPPLNLNVPVTQNTAPVIKFRCLYTYDLRRKAKRWQDGYLRFHTFNKRVMAYDTTGNFIGDLHWRQDESVQDGDELELDRGVLIQVCESVEKTETDLDVCMTAYHVPPNLEFAPSASTQFALDETAGASESHGDQNTRIQGILSTRSSAGLRKSYSDPTALTTLHGLQPRSTSSRSRLNTHLDEDTAHDQGPWTSEALDLFDFWPLGRPKPI